MTERAVIHDREGFLPVMAGRTQMVVGRWHGRYIHIPMALAVSHRNQVRPDGDLWMSVLEATGQPARFC